MSSENPLLDLSGPPRFTAIRPEHVEPAVAQRIREVEEAVERLTGPDGPKPATWAEFVEPLDAALEGLDRAWGPVEHLNSVMNSDALRAVYREAKPRITDHAARLSQDERLFRAMEEVERGAEAEGLDAAQRKAVADALRDFRLAGVDLPPEKKERYRAIQVELADLANRFGDNLIDESKEYRFVVDDPAKLEGLPPGAVAQARAKALEDDPDAPEGRHAFTLHIPSFLPFLQYQRDRALRQELHRAYATRCTRGERDNSPLIDRILVLRNELADLLGLESYAELSLATKMAESAPQVHAFLTDLATRSLPYGRRDQDELAAFARERDGVEEFQAWDKGFYREALRQSRYSFSEEEVRQYFPLDRVLSGLFETLKRLYGIEMRDRTADGVYERWHPDVRVLEVVGEDGEVTGHLFLDLFARDGKRQGAWMGDCVERVRRRASGLQRPIAYLVCNFTPPLGGEPSTLRHDEVRTLFHECGHALHHVLTQVDVRSVSGINNVPWDGVELPSQFHENWVWERETLAYLAGHVETGEPLPDELLDRMLAAKNFQSGSDMLRQLEFSLFDLELHMGFDPRGERSVQDVIDDVRERVSVLKPPPYDRFQNGFTHVFAGGYAAGYYSYKWAEVLAADAFSRFEEEGIFSREAGRAFKEHVLERGGSDDLMKLYVAFRGREPTPDALMRHSGLVGAVE